MNKIIGMGLAVGMALSSPSFAADAVAEEDKLSYSLGLMIGKRMLQNYESLDFDVMLKAMQAGYGNGETAMTEADADKFLRAFAKEQQSKAAAAAKEKGEKFLAENKAKEGVKVTDSGLQYEVVKAGTGDKPKPTDQVKVHYRGTLLDGTEFDSSYSRNQPATFPLNRVIKGWQEGLQLMSPGAEFTFYIPADLAYGSNGAGGNIGPNETLVFKVELLEVNPKAE